MSRINNSAKSKINNPKLNKEIYEKLMNFGLVIEVSYKKIALGKWGNKTQSDKYSPLKNYAIIPKKDKNINQYLTIIDIDTKKGSKGLDSLKSLESDLNIKFIKTVKSPSGGFHIYLISDIEPQFKRYNKKYPDLEFLHCNSSKNGYILLATNKDIVSSDKKGNKIVGEYKLLVDIYSIFTKEANLIANKAVIKLNNMLSPNKENKKDTKYDTKYDSDNFDTILPEQLDTLLFLNDNEDYLNWVVNGGAYKSAGGNLDKFIKWSQSATNAETDIGKLKSKWEVLPVGEIGVGTLYHNAIKSKLNQIKSIISNSSDLDKDTKKIANIVSEYPFIGKNKNLDTIEELIKEKAYKLNNYKHISGRKLNNLISNIWNDNYYDNISEIKKDDDDNIFNKYIFEGSSSTYGDILSSKMKVGDDWIEHELSYQEQYTIIKDIFNRIKIIKEDGLKAIAFDEKSNRVLFIPLAQNQLNLFKNAMVKQFPKVISKDRSKQYINLLKIRDVLLLLHNSDYSELYNTESILYKNVYSINEDGDIIKNNKSKTFNDMLNSINIVKNEVDKDIIDDIVNEFHKHYKGLMQPLTKYLLLSKFFSNNKGMDIMFLAPTNFGKGYFFSIFDELGVAKFSDIEDYSRNGGSINNAPIEDYKLSYFNIFDEKSVYTRSLFSISGSLKYRGLYKSSTTINVGAKVFLDADGKTLNFEGVDEQIKNRVNIFDFRNISSDNIDTLQQKILNNYYIDDDTLRDIILSYYHDFILDTIEEYKSLKRYKLNQVRKQLEEELFKNEAYINKEDIKNVEDSINDTILEVVENPDMLCDMVSKDSNIDNNVSIHKSLDKIVISNPNKVLKDILLAYNNDLKYELSKKNLKSMVEHGKLEFLSYGSMRDINNRIKKGIIINLKAIEDYLFNDLSNIKKIKAEWQIKGDI